MDNEYESRINWFISYKNNELPSIVKEVGNIKPYYDSFGCEDYCQMNEGRVTYIIFNSKAKTNAAVLKAMVESGWERTTVKRLPFYYKYVHGYE